MEGQLTNEMDGACGTQGEEGRCIKVSVGNWRETDHLRDLGIDGRISTWIFRKTVGTALTRFT
jgi:hypothetical protein